MPPLYDLDDFDICLSDPGGTYCVVDLNLYSNQHSDLLQYIHEYSADKYIHYNYTQIHRGVCVSTKCKHLRNMGDLNTTLEACLNDTMWREYRLQAKLNKVHYCRRDDDSTALDSSDLGVIIVYMILIALNVIASLYDILFCNQNSKSGNPYILSFSLKRNWAKLIAPSGDGPDSRYERLRSFQGLRALTMICIIFSHSAVVMAITYTRNPLYIEKALQDISKHVLFNGSLVTHTFFVMSSFLLAYNFEINAEKTKVTWWQFPRAVILRFLRITPTYALVLATVSTVIRHIGNGPLWDLIVVKQSHDCRNNWWAHILYVQNYVYYDGFCMQESWYLAADMQLFIVGVLTCVLLRDSRSKKIGLTILFLISLIITSASTYFLHLDPIVIQSPETLRTMYTENRTFRHMYIAGHTNLSTYVLGLAGGFLAYHWQTEAKDMTRFKKYRWLVWAGLPLGVMVIMSGVLFYSSTDTTPVYFKVAYAMFSKPFFQLLVVQLILSCICKIESVYRGIVEWQGFSWAGKLTYGAYLLHTTYLRGFIGSQPLPIHMSDYNVLILTAATVLLSYLSAAALWLCVEAPAAALTKTLFMTTKRVTRQ
ncbi:nose resistant to fluoxetine protein 6-like [Battus philenor]|uniref:nose resistant to fluoxetine protein 6-like n=1 Tax=Battus philenor TaxID=42288 RepID=UPI0035CFF8CC